MSYTTGNEEVFTNNTVGGPLFVHVKDGKIVRLEPLQLGPDDAERSFPLQERRGSQNIPWLKGQEYILPTGFFILL